MATAIDAALVKFHASLNVSDLPKSIAFYRALLGTEPAKVRDNYAKFDIAEPPLVLSLIPGRPGAAGGHLNHAGLRVRTADELVGIQRRLEMAGHRTEREDGVECCYAKQTKFWVTDPDKALWEVYVFHEDVAGSADSMQTAATIRRLRDDVPAAAAAPAAAPVAEAAPAAWTHRLSTPLPDAVPAGEATLDEVHLQGTINASLEPSRRAALFAEIRRALKPGASLQVHGLAGDRPLASRPSLPGPAAVVEYVPTAAEVVRELEAAGFVEIAIGTLSRKPPFVQAGVPLREIRLSARTPAAGAASATAPHRAVYLGPLAAVTDDAGNLFRRGEMTPVSAREWERLAAGPLRDAFLLLEPEPTTLPLTTASCCAAS